MSTNTVWWHLPNQVRTVSFKDGIIRKVRVRYQNHNEQSSRETYRSTRKLVLIHSIGELDLINEMYKMAIYVDNFKK